MFTSRFAAQLVKLRKSLSLARLRKPNFIPPATNLKSDGDRSLKSAAPDIWNRSEKVKRTLGTTEDIMIQRGVRQGSILSPSLSNLYSEYQLQEAVSEKSSILINGVNINNIRYVDDTVILAESEEQLQAMLDRIVDKCKDYGMEINAKKTKTMHFGKDTKTLKITVENAVFEQVSEH
ncbi:retrovirus-related Pol polyprotein LINE-1 [Elysia marginata]|uniref:Retrovirus-related Pol polyprotein LINE-1 n=1 Tax=Elysia marginata TaxID=1093978 RepID=A0AAV4GSM1_9GAST|nr:retrovirus-related Pol polyprotein LINE-1 [Elysia marginata]